MKFNSGVDNCLLLLVGLIFFSGSSWAEVSYEQSPIEFYSRLRGEFRQGRSVAGEIRQVIRRWGDHSFDSLLRQTAARRSAVRLEQRAYQAWVDGDYPKALRLYQRAAADLLREQAFSEAAFCLYYVAEIYSEQEHYSEALRWSQKALAVAASRNRPYLEALLFESRAYALWYLSELQESVHGFSLALQRWQRIAFEPGSLMCWNNLAVLYEELRLWESADYCYRKALEISSVADHPEILFYLHSNYALFLHKRGKGTGAEQHLEAARRLNWVSPSEFLLLTWKLSKSSGRLDGLLAFQPDLPSLQIERALLLGKTLEENGDWEDARRYYEEALSVTRSRALKYYLRKSVLQLGRLLERNRQYEKASELYLSTLSEEESLLSAGFAFPYRRSISPLFDGRIRCLIRLGRAPEAWGEIQRLIATRQSDMRLYLKALPELEFRGDELAQFTQVMRLEARRKWGQTTRFSSRGQRSLSPFSESTAHQGFTVIEMWPDGDRVYAWLSTTKGRVFRELSLPQDLGTAIEKLVGPLYRASDSLPPRPEPQQLQTLYRYLFAPLEGLIESNSILLVPHKELQSLPLELLQTFSGDYLVNHYSFSYLPSWHQTTRATPGGTANPFLLMPDISPALAEARREEVFFRGLIPQVTVLKEFDALPAEARWLHVSTHLKLNPRFWMASHFESSAQDRNILQLLRRPLNYGLLSLGACDGANAYMSASPSWLGFSEFFLLRGAQSLLLSRWQMDELSSWIYREFYRLSRAGIPMEEALASAKRDFLGRTLQRGASKAAGSHPFFWAGITYVGPPGRRLYEPGSLPGAPAYLVTAIVALVAILYFRGLGRRKIRRLSPSCTVLQTSSEEGRTDSS